jgi:hypothetical protein
MLSPPSPANGLPVIHIDSILAVLEKLELKVPIADVIKAMFEENQARHVKSTANETQRDALLFEGKLAPPPCLSSDNKPVQRFHPHSKPTPNSLPPSASLSLLTSIRWWKNVVVVFSKLAETPSLRL